MNCNVHVFCKIIFSNKFWVILETVFSYTGTQQTLWMTLLTLVWNRPTSKRPRIFTPPNQYQHSEHYFSENWVKTSILNKDGSQDNIQLDLGQQAGQVVQQQVPAGTKKHNCIQDRTNQNSRILQTEEQGHNFGTWFYLQNWWPCQDQQLEWDGHLQQCCQHPQRFCSKMAILHSGHAGLHGRPAYLD